MEKVIPPTRRLGKLKAILLALPVGGSTVIPAVGYRKWYAAAGRAGVKISTRACAGGFELYRVN